MDNTFVCAMCKEEFEKGWSDDEAVAEMKEVWGNISFADCDQVCDDCWEKVKPSNNKEFFETWKLLQIPD